jgi:GT2 family glycosyltransferase
LARIDDSLPGAHRLTDWRVLRPQGPQLHQKNWMPRIISNSLQFIQLRDPTRVIDENGRVLAETIPPIAAENFRGSTQAIRFDHGWLALVHEVSERDKRRFYQHRFVWLDDENNLRRVSRPFFFIKNGVEFASGLASDHDGKGLLISFSANNGEAWIATVVAGDVRGLLEDASRLPSGAAPTQPTMGLHAISNGIKTHPFSTEDTTLELNVEGAKSPQMTNGPCNGNCRRIFVMISTKRSLFYTRHALASFFRCTDVTAADKFILIANDHDATEFRSDQRLEVIENKSPQSFSANVNVALRAAKDTGADVLLLNNDMIFTEGWLPPLLQFPNAITLPMCNQQYQYREGDLDLRYLMEWDQFADRFEMLQQIARSHKERFVENPTQTDLLMPLYCFHLPNKILHEVGEFDESFGHAGGEDVDYRLRTLLSGYDVVYAGQSYVLHFMGKSTWRSGEPPAETAARDQAYFARFRQKWGDDAAAIFLATRVSL